MIQFPGLFGLLKFHPVIYIYSKFYFTRSNLDRGTRIMPSKAEAKALKEAAPDPNKKEAKVT